MLQSKYPSGWRYGLVSAIFEHQEHAENARDYISSKGGQHVVCEISEEEPRLVAVIPPQPVEREAPQPQPEPVHWFAVGCPTCQQPAGSPCLATSGRETDKPHIARKRVAIRLRETQRRKDFDETTHR